MIEEIRAGDRFEWVGLGAGSVWERTEGEAIRCVVAGGGGAVGQVLLGRYSDWELLNSPNWKRLPREPEPAHETPKPAVCVECGLGPALMRVMGKAKPYPWCDDCYLKWESGTETCTGMAERARKRRGQHAPLEPWAWSQLRAVTGGWSRRAPK